MSQLESEYVMLLEERGAEGHSFSLVTGLTEDGGAGSARMKPVHKQASKPVQRLETEMFEDEDTMEFSRVPAREFSMGKVRIHAAARSATGSVEQNSMASSVMDRRSNPLRVVGDIDEVRPYSLKDVEKCEDVKDMPSSLEDRGSNPTLSEVDLEETEGELVVENAEEQKVCSQDTTPSFWDNLGFLSSEVDVDHVIADPEQMLLIKNKEATDDHFLQHLGRSTREGSLVEEVDTETLAKGPRQVLAVHARIDNSTNCSKQMRLWKDLDISQELDLDVTRDPGEPGYMKLAHDNTTKTSSSLEDLSPENTLGSINGLVELDALSTMGGPEIGQVSMSLEPRAHTLRSSSCKRMGRALAAIGDPALARVDAGARRSI